MSEQKDGSNKADEFADAAKTKQRVLYCYLDESGNFDFSDSGSEYYFQSALVTSNPYPLLGELQKVKYGLYMRHLLLSKSHSSNDFFHATEDAPYTRESVYESMSKHCDEFAVYSISVKKNRTPIDKRDARIFYQMVFENLIGRVIVDEAVADSYDCIFVLTDKIPVQKHRRAIIGSLKKALSIALEGTATNYVVVDMDSKSDFGLQAADYCTWAIHRLWSHSDSRYYGYLASAFKPPIVQYPRGISVK